MNVMNDKFHIINYISTFFHAAYSETFYLGKKGQRGGGMMI